MFTIKVKQIHKLLKKLLFSFKLSMMNCYKMVLISLNLTEIKENMTNKEI